LIGSSTGGPDFAGQLCRSRSGPVGRVGTRRAELGDPVSAMQLIPFHVPPRPNQLRRIRQSGIWRFRQVFKGPAAWAWR